MAKKKKYRHSKKHKKIRNAIWFARFGAVAKIPCFWCKIDISFKESTLDHVTAIFDGGGYSNDNLVLACWKCNQERGAEVSKRANQFHKSKSAQKLMRSENFP